MRELHKLLNRECLSVTETEKLFQYLIRGPQLTPQNQIARHSRRLKSNAGETPSGNRRRSKSLISWQ